MLHGYTGNAAQIAEQTGLVQPAQQAGLVAAFRMGQVAAGTSAAEQAVGAVRPTVSAKAEPPDHVAVLKMLASDLVRRGVADPKRIYLAGRSLAAP